ncbi:LuxR C-terminal-related transcriptional regulator [Leucobacter massiliensis]|uniref:DNA-binding response regulator n=1 Tax=Leucobacter massiliensis TaxID=1686285 RepID=A0A2S9QNJ9_9MICO|nr:response regulator transcription factor [Leucobacter massiliensis]PRI11150.1 DNA-binding response regulator [Leucobacter massiliensis]
MIRVALVDDQALVRSGFRIILESEPDIVVVGEAASGAEAVELAAREHPGVICMDVEMPGGFDGIEASRRILASVADAGADADAGAGAAGSADGAAPAILILTTFGHESYLFEALAAGVSGFLLKTSRAEQLIDAVRSLAAGDALLGPDVTRAVIARVAADRVTPPGAADPGRPGGSGPGRAREEAFERAGLTERERGVLALLAEGRSNAEIAAALFLGEATVKTHVSNVLQKLGVRDRIQAVVWAHTRGAA